MCLPVDRSMTVSPPQRIAQVIFSTSSWMLEPSAELPMLALIFTRKLRPMIICSGFRMVDVGGNDGAAARDLVPDEFRRDLLRQARAEILAGMLPRDQFRQG